MKQQEEKYNKKWPLKSNTLLLAKGRQHKD